MGADETEDEEGEEGEGEGPKSIESGCDEGGEVGKAGFCVKGGARSRGGGRRG